MIDFNNTTGAATYFALRMLAAHQGGGGEGGDGAYAPFPPEWPVSAETTTAEFCAMVNVDPSATVGKAYLGEARWSDLPANMINAEVVVEILDGSETGNKVIHLICTSGNQAPYRWEYTYWNDGSSTSGWIGFQPEPFVIPVVADAHGQITTTLTAGELIDAVNSYGANIIIRDGTTIIPAIMAVYDPTDHTGLIQGAFFDGDAEALKILAIEFNTTNVEIEIVEQSGGAAIYEVVISAGVGTEYVTTTTTQELAAAITDGKTIVLNFTPAHAKINGVVTSSYNNQVRVEGTIIDHENELQYTLQVAGVTSTDIPCTVDAIAYPLGQLTIPVTYDSSTGVFSTTRPGSTIINALKENAEVVVELSGTQYTTSVEFYNDSQDPEAVISIEGIWVQASPDQPNILIIDAHLDSVTITYQPNLLTWGVSQGKVLTSDGSGGSTWETPATPNAAVFVDWS